MLLKQRSYLLFFVAVCFFSCQKEVGFNDPPPTGNNNSIIGNFDLVDMRVQATTEATSNAAPGELYITYTDYTTKNNQGTVAITSSTMATVNLAYSIDTIIKGYFYSGGLLTDSVETPFMLTMPPSSSTATYTVAGTDSIIVQAGLFNSPMGSGITPPTEPAGVTYSWNGNILTLKTLFKINSSQVISGGTINLKYTGTQWVRLKKK